MSFVFAFAVLTVYVGASEFLRRRREADVRREFEEFQNRVRTSRKEP